jgi:hypothetical protein
MLSALLLFLQQRDDMVDERIKRQLDDVCIAIREVLAQLEDIPASNGNGKRNRAEEYIE